MYWRLASTIILISCFVSLLTVSAIAQEVTMVDAGVSSNVFGYTISLTIDPGMNYLTFTRVAYGVNRMRIRDAVTGDDIYFGTPTVGTKVYLPNGRYFVTGWSGLYDESPAAVTLALAPDEDTPVTVIYNSSEYRNHVYREYGTYREMPMGTIHHYRSRRVIYEPYSEERIIIRHR